MNRPTFEAEMLRSLRQLPPVDPPTPGFAARALRVQSPTWAQVARGMAMAASLMLAVGLGVWLGLRSVDSGEAIDARVVWLAPGEVQAVSLMFRSPRDLKGVKIELEVPEGLELAGRPGVASLSWTTDLQIGDNRLLVPVIVRRGTGGVLMAKLSYGQDIKQLAVLVNAREPGTGT